MYSLNVPIPGRVNELAWELRSSLTDFELLRDELTLVIKRLPVDDANDFSVIRERADEVLSDTPPFEARTVGIGVFDHPPAGPSPVVFIAVESPELERVHERLSRVFAPVPEIEGCSYRAHVTLARGGNPDQETLERLEKMELESIEWTVDRLVYWDAKHEVPAGEIVLPTRSKIG